MATQNDLEFHSLILMEHCTFLHLGLEASPLKDEAFQHYQNWKDFIDSGYQGDVMVLVQRLKAFKTNILDRLNGGEWLGWLSASFVGHILEELVQFELLLNGRRPTPEIEAVQSLTLMGDHLASAAKMIDPLEVGFNEDAQDLIESTPRPVTERDANTVLEQYQEAAHLLSYEHGQPSTDVQWMIGLTLRAGEQIDHLFGHILEDKPRSIIHPLLIDHWRREQHHMSEELSMTLEMLQQRSRQ
jgi:hypothetical protein